MCVRDWENADICEGACEVHVSEHGEGESESLSVKACAERVCMSV